MKCLISITKFSNLALLYFIFLFSSGIIIFFIKKEIINEMKKVTGYTKESYYFIIILFMNLSECLSFVYFIIRYLKTKNKKDNSIVENKELSISYISYIFYMNNFKNNYHNLCSFFSFFSKDYKSIFIIILISLFDFVMTVFLMQHAVDFYGVSGFTGLILFKYLFKYQIYNHHILSIIILGIVSLFQIIISFSKRKEKALYQILYNICNGAFLILVKYLIDIKQIESLIILFLEGFFGFIFLLLFYFIFKFSDTITYFKLFNYFSGTFYLFLILYTILASFYNVILFLLIENTPSIYSLFIFNISVYFSHFIFYRKELLKGLFLIIFILNIINIFAMLVFIEFFVLNFCGLNYNCKINIQKREIEEKKNVHKEVLNNI